MYTHMCTYTDVYIYIYAYVYTHMCIHIYIYIYMYVYTYFPDMAKPTYLTSEGPTGAALSRHGENSARPLRATE